MTAAQEKYAKTLRQCIMAISHKKYNWDYDQFHEIMVEWGYGKSLRKLQISKLKDLKNQLNGVQSNLRPEEWELDDQGKYMWSLMKQIGWNRKRITYFMTKKYHKTHWNLLSGSEKRGVINMLKSYRNKSQDQS